MVFITLDYQYHFNEFSEYYKAIIPSTFTEYYLLHKQPVFKKYDKIAIEDHIKEMIQNKDNDLVK